MVTSVRVRVYLMGINVYDIYAVAGGVAVAFVLYAHRGQYFAIKSTHDDDNDYYYD